MHKADNVGIMSASANTVCCFSFTKNKSEADWNAPRAIKENGMSDSIGELN